MPKLLERVMAEELVVYLQSGLFRGYNVTSEQANLAKLHAFAIVGHA